MNAAPCSWRVVTWRTVEWSASASSTSIVSSPGTENTHSQPSAARQSTRRWAAVRRGAGLTRLSLRGVGDLDPDGVEVEVLPVHRGHVDDPDPEVRRAQLAERPRVAPVVGRRAQGVGREAVGDVDLLGRRPARAAVPRQLDADEARAAVVVDLDRRLDLDAPDRADAARQAERVAPEPVPVLAGVGAAERRRRARVDVAGRGAVEGAGVARVGLVAVAVAAGVELLVGAVPVA